MRRALFGLLTCFWIGLVWSSWWGLGAFLLGALLGLRGWPSGLALLGLGAGALVGVAQSSWLDARPAALPAGPQRAKVESLRLQGGRAVVRARLESVPACQVVTWLQSRPEGLAPGARVLVFGPYRRPPPADNPGDVDRSAWWGARGVCWQARSLQLTEGGRGLAVEVRAWTRRQLRRGARPYGADVLAGLLLGDRAQVPKSAERALRAAGVGHLLAVSGLHVGGVALLLFGLGAAIGRRRRHLDPGRLGALLALPGALLFVALAQFPVSACRAGAMVALASLARLLGRSARGPELLAAAALILLASRPAAANEVGFQLSFAAVGALMLGAEARPAEGSPVALLAPGSPLRVALLAALATWPVAAWHFGTVAPIAPLANLLLVPLGTLLVPLGLLGLALAPLSTLPLDLAAALAELLVAGAEAFADLLGLQIVGRAAAPALLGLLLLQLRPPHARALAALAFALSLLLWPRGAHMDFIAVGQGDAILVRDGGAVLIDAGPDPRARALVGHLKRSGVRHLEALVITHWHPDHHAGMEALAAEIPIRRILHNGSRAGVGQVARPERLDLAHTRLTLIPSPLVAGRENDRSVSVRVDGPAASALLTGDLEAAGEAALLATDPRPVSLFKAGHHGSRTSSSEALLRALRPQVVVATLGRDNRYGFPHRSVRDRLERLAIPLWRTDRDGLVRVDLERASMRAQRRSPQKMKP